MTTTKSPGFSTVFVGSSTGLQNIDPAAISAPLIADGDVGLYGHMSGIVNAYNSGVESGVVSTWAGTGSGLIESSQWDPTAIMYVTVANTGSAAITIPIGTLVSSKSGVQFQVVQKPRQEEGWSNTATGVGSAGYYTIQPGQSIQMTTQALVDGPSGNLLDNELTQIGIAGAKVTASSLLTTAEEWGVGTVTITNKGSSDQYLYTSQQVFGSGGTYNIGIDPTVKGFVGTNGDNSAGYYKLAAGQTVTVPIGSVKDISASTASGTIVSANAEAAPANSIIGSALWSGLVVDSSSAITIQGITDPASQQTMTQFGRTGFFTDAQSGTWLSGQGYDPTEDDVDTTNLNIWTKQDLVNWEAYVDSARSFGVLNLAPMMSEFETVDFATATATQYARAGALYGGGIAFDMPPWFFLAREAAYQQSTYSEIKWATANGLRSSITLSPVGPNDENFLAQTKQMMAMLQANGALPTQLVIKDEGVTGSSVIFDTTDPNSFNNVAQYLSTLTLTPSNSESMLETHGTGGTNRVDDLMTGVQQNETVKGTAPIHPFAAAQIFGETITAKATVTISVANPVMGKLSAPSGTTSANGATYTVTGTMAQITAAVGSVAFTAAAGATGGTVLTTMVTDAAGTITGTTALAVSNPVDPAYTVDSTASIYTVEDEPGRTATVNLATHIGNTTVYGGQANLVLTGANSTVFSNTAVSTGSVDITSTGGDTIHTGGENVSFIAGGRNSILVGSSGGNSGTVTIYRGGSSDATQIVSSGDATSPETVINTGSAPTTVYGGAANLSYTGGHSTVIDNGSLQTGTMAVHSLGDDIVWSGNSRTDLYAGSGNDTLVAGNGLAVIHGSWTDPSSVTSLVSNASTGRVEYDGGFSKADLAVNDDSAVVFAGMGRETMTLGGSGSLIAVSGTWTTGEQDVVVAATAKGSLAYWGGAAAANLALGGGSAFVEAGSGNTTLTGGSGNLDLLLSKASSATVRIDGATGGDAAVFGFDPKTATVAFTSVADTRQTSGGFVVDMEDGHAVTFYGVTSHAGITFG